MPKTPAADKKRQRKTPEQRATEALEVAERRVTKAEERVEAAEKDLRESKAELRDAQARRDYVAKDPALPANQPDPEQPTLPEDDD